MLVLPVKYEQLPLDDRLSLTGNSVIKRNAFIKITVLLKIVQTFVSEIFYFFPTCGTANYATDS